MGASILLTFTGIPEENDFITLNPNFLGIDITETFKASRVNPKETTIGATIAETIQNFKTAFDLDFDSQLSYDITTTDDTILINFPNGGSGNTFDETISSDVISYILNPEHFLYFTSEYDNKVDNFRLEILGTDPTFTPEYISATAVLSYKDVDNILAPIRGAQLDIDIDANIDKPYNLFLDFREKDFKVKFYRNDDLFFEGFINPEGVAQDYNSINWRAKLVAVDNLGSLKNTEHPYSNELPSEYVFMDLALKKTGLDLPIAFFDDINQNVISNNVTIEYLTKLEDPINERLIEPDTFKNENDRFENCEVVLLDILQKYNAMLVQTPVKYLNIDTGQEESMLCWLFCRVPIMNRPITNLNSDFKIKKITGYTDDGNGVLFPNVLDYNYKFGIPFNRIGTDGQGTQFLPLNGIHKNKNQLIRQTRALKAFRFVHEWAMRDDWLFYNYERLYIFNGFFFQNDYVLDDENKLLLRSNGLSSYSTNGYVFNPVASVSNEIDELVELPELTEQIEIFGNADIIWKEPIAGDLSSQRKFILCQVFQVIESGVNEGVYLAKPLYENTSSDNFDPSQITNVVWEKISSDPTDGLDSFGNYENLLYLLSTNQVIHNSSNVEFKLQLPFFQYQGGKINVLLSSFNEVNTAGGQTLQKKFDLILNELKIKAVAPSRFGEGNYYDAENTQDVSSKIGDDLKIINADDKTDFFLNGIKRSYGDNANYPFWTSYWNLQPNKGDILELTSIERIRLLSKSQNIFSGDIHGYIPYFTRMVNTAYPANVPFVFTKWQYDTAENTIESEMMECKVLTPDVKFEKNVIFEDEDKKLID